MLLNFTIPLADVRPFLDVDTHRLREPAWPRPALARQRFLRGFGSVRPRPQGGVDGWDGESMFCDAAGALRFHVTLGLRPLSVPTGRINLSCAYRRLYADGRGCARVDLGIVLSGAGLTNLTSKDLIHVAGQVLTLPVSVRVGPKNRTCLLGEAGPPIAASYLAASSKAGLRPDQQSRNWWVTEGVPFTTIELESHQLPSDNGFAPVDALLLPPSLSVHGAVQPPPPTLWYTQRIVFNQRMVLWLVPRAPRGTLLFQHLRRARLHLVRLQTELQCVQWVLAYLGSGRLSLPDGEEAPGSSDERLRRYLSDALGLLTRDSRDGLRHDPVLKSLTASLPPIAIEEYQSVETQLQRALGSADRLTQTRFRALASSGHVVNIYTKDEVIVSNQSINVGAGATVTNSPLTQAGRDADIKARYERIETSGAGEDLKTALKEIHRLIDEGLAQLGGDDATRQKVTRKLDDFTAEATSQTVDKDSVKISADGLITAAKTIAAVSAPITTAVKAVLALLGIG
jgi:hypothetical protein